MARNVSSYLPDLIGPVTISNNGTAVPARGTIKFRGANFVDDAENNEMTIELPDAQLTTDNSDAPQETTEFETTNATPTTVGTTFSIPTNTILVVDIQAVVQRAGGDRTKVFNIRRYLQNTNGTITAPAQENTMGPTEIGGALSCTVAITYTGTTARVEFTGIAATNLRVRLDRQVTTLAAGDPAIVVSAITPNTGTAAGGTSVSITVDSSTGATGATVGGVALTGFAIADATHVTGTTGAHSAGAVDVTVTNAEGTGTLSSGFTYTSAFDPLTLPEASGTPIVYLDTADMTVGGGLVSAIVNQAGGGAVITIPGGNKPTQEVANADYDGEDTAGCTSNQGIQITNHGLTTGPFWVVFVADGTDNYWMQDGNGTSGITAGGGSGDKLQITNDAGTYLAGAVAKSGVPGVYIMQFANNPNAKIWESKLTPVTGNAGTLGDLTGVTIGVGNVASLSGVGLNGSIREYMLGSGTLSTNDATYLLNGFGDKHGLTIGA